MAQGTSDIIKSIYGTAKSDFLIPDTTGAENPFAYRIYGYDGNDTLTGATHDDVLRGSTGNDVLFGKQGNDTLYGGAGSDALMGGNGNDVLYAGAAGGIDRIGRGSPESGPDTLHGGAGDDRLITNNVAHLYGGDGRDTFVFGGDADESIIHDFQKGLDKIDLSNWDVHYFGQLSFVPISEDQGIGVLVNTGEIGAHVQHMFIVDGAGDFQLSASDFIFDGPVRLG